MASAPLANNWGSAQYPIIVEDSDDLTSNDQDLDTDDEEPGRRRPNWRLGSWETATATSRLPELRRQAMSTREGYLDVSRA